MIYSWFQTDVIAGITLRQIEKTEADEKLCLHSFVGYHPNDLERCLSYKPFFYLNSQAVNFLPIHEVSIIVMENSVKLSAILCDDPLIEDEAKYTFAREIANSIMETLNAPDVFMKI